MKNLPVIHGTPVDNHTRCVHYHSVNDIIAIKFKCCGNYYPCHQCHEDTAGHAPQVWPKAEWDEKAVVCGNCATEMSINDYMHSNNTCPTCASSFNPNCHLHYSLYFSP